MLAPNSNDPHRPRAAIHPDGSVEGYASLFGEIDQARDMVMPGAFARTLQQRGLRRIPMLFQHDPAEPIGIWQEIAEDWRGLRVRGRLIPEVVRARELLALLREGAADGLSIGFKTVKAGRDPKQRIRKLFEIELWEISIVTFPLLPGARLRAVPGTRVRAAKAVSAPLPRHARARESDPPAILRAKCARCFAMRDALHAGERMQTLDEIRTEILRLNWHVAALRFQRALRRHVFALKAGFNPDRR